MEELTREQARAALAELEAGKRAVTSAETRTRPMLLTAYSGLALVDYAAKDYLGSRRAQWGVTAICQLITLGLTLLEQDRNPVQPATVENADRTRLTDAPFIAALVGWPLAERLLVTALRRSNIRRPNTLAGVALAATRPAGYLGLYRLIPRPAHHG